MRSVCRLCVLGLPSAAEPMSPPVVMASRWRCGATPPTARPCRGRAATVGGPHDRAAGQSGAAERPARTMPTRSRRRGSAVAMAARVRPRCAPCWRRRHQSVRSAGALATVMITTLMMMTPR
eukprot:scaffold568_cov376-Prasinococcus_capsulatus_cf.AAC.4